MKYIGGSLEACCRVVSRPASRGYAAKGEWGEDQGQSVMVYGLGERRDRKTASTHETRCEDNTSNQVLSISDSIAPDKYNQFSLHGSPDRHPVPAIQNSPRT